jgi:hypothetical protein
MSLKDKLEIGLKPDAPFRKDNLPEFQQDKPSCEVAATPGDSKALRQARAACEAPVASRRNRPAPRTVTRRRR